jgi:histidinol-phosphate aminotransferase
MLKPTLAAIPPYRVATPPHRVKLNQNECAQELPAAIRRRILARLRAEEWRRYPPFPAEGLRRRLARRLRLGQSAVLLGNGSNEVLLSAVLATLRRGSRVVVPAPGYPVFERLAAICEAKVRRVRGGADLGFRPEALAEEAGKRGTALVLIASPCNPTGAALSPAEVRRIAEATPALVVVDEAYHEFSRHDYAPLVRKLPNLVVTRTFSKAFALAGLRLGYALGDAEVVARLEAATLPFNLDLFSQIAGEEILDAADVVGERVRRTVAERERLRAWLERRAGAAVFPSEANFLLVRFADGRRAWKRLLDHGILVRDVSAQPGLGNCLRITVGTPRENRALRRALEEILP